MNWTSTYTNIFKNHADEYARYLVQAGIHTPVEAQQEATNVVSGLAMDTMNDPNGNRYFINFQKELHLVRVIIKQNEQIIEQQQQILQYQQQQLLRQEQQHFSNTNIPTPSPNNIQVVPQQQQQQQQQQDGTVSLVSQATIDLTFNATGELLGEDLNNQDLDYWLNSY